MEKWKQYRLIEVLDALIDYRGKTPKKTASGVPLITAKIIKNGRIETPTEFISVDDYDSWMVRGFPKIGDVVLTTEAPLGEVAQLDDAKIALAQRVVTLRGKSGILDNTYLKYYFLSKVGQQRLKARETGTTVTGIKQSELREVIVDVPPYDVQIRIAEVLQSLDSKIEVNRRINNNLEQQAIALFRSWVENKCTDRIYLSEIAEFTSGYSYKGDELKTSKIAMATIKNFDRRGGFKLDGFKEVVPSKKLKESQTVNLYDILVAHTDLTQNAEVIGNAEMLLSLGGYDRIIFSMDLVKVEPKKDFPYKFILAALLRTSEFKIHSLGYVNGTTVLHLSKKGLQDYKFVLTRNTEELNKMNVLLGDLYRRQAHIIEQNVILANLRDTLLPRLISGKLKVNEIEDSL